MDTASFFGRLSALAERDTAVVATLRRSLAFEPGTYAPAFPIIEPSLACEPEWRRRLCYLAAGLWSLGQRRGTGAPVPLATALHRLARARDSGSLELRFTALLDSDVEELPHRLRQAVGLLSAEQIALDWPQLLADLFAWQNESRAVQRRWARAYWSHPESDSPAAKEPAAASSDLTS